MNPTPVNATVLTSGFVMVNVSVDVPPAPIGFNENDLLMDGGAMTFNVADAVLPVPPLVEVTASLVFG